MGTSRNKLAVQLLSRRNLIVALVVQSAVASARPIAVASPVRRHPGEKLEDLETLRGIEVVVDTPASRPRAFVFFDPNCPYCANLWKFLHGQGRRPMDIQARWIPVAYMNSTSRGRCAYILEHGGREALDVNFRGFDFQRRMGAGREVLPSPGNLAALRDNNGVWHRYGAMTPVTIYQGVDGVTTSIVGLADESVWISQMSGVGRGTR